MLLFTVGKIDHLIWKKVHMWLALAMCSIPVLFLLRDAYILSENLTYKYRIVGVVSSPYSASKNIDLNDGQLNAFLEGLPILTFIAVMFITLRRFLFHLHNSITLSLIYYSIFGIAYGIYIHGPGVVFLLAMIISNHFITKTFAGINGFPLIIWIGNMAFMILAEYYHGFKFAWFFEGLDFLDNVPVILNWYRVNNLCMLKIVSYTVDYHWKVSNKIVDTHEKHKKKCDECKKDITCLKFRMESHGQRFGLLCFIAYSFYPPLYVAGPTLTYNAWISQVELPQQTFDRVRMIKYILRFSVIFLILLWFMHNLYFPTIANNSQNRHILDAFTPYELIIASYFILKWIWLKFTVIWRFFRIWALFDGIESPENMGRCMSNNYCFEGFWRMWHRAFNQWLIRYLFIPLGGSQYKVFNIWAVFGFVALWHDLTLNLLAWGWGMCLFIMPEVLVKAYFSSPKREAFRKTFAYSFMCAIAGGVYICLMIMANLVGFSFGLSGLKVMLEGLINLEGLFLMIKVLTVLSIGSHFMFLYRENETRKGIKDKGY
ncbi:hypothetical protein SteCoe_25727 [Stentor coeruleus]|uniref:Uncharacterized protein n=1 Tax=Stentor coeruleus TaxID=5963 RepID=A0A1R2BEP8_9CILI|nr:hypothetical protein SteCoe_25727 [Stentor coeruleus]